VLSRIDELHVDPVLFQPLETKIGIAGWTLPVVDDLDGFLNRIGHSLIDPCIEHSRVLLRLSQ
jgi:hypothetical protein